MIIEEAFSVPAPPDEVAAFLLDVERMSRCVPGVGGVRDVGNGSYEATLEVRLGPIRSQFAGRVDVDGSAAPDRLSAVGQGRDRSTGSQAQVRFEAELTAQPDGSTSVATTADVTIRGRLGQFGTGVISSTAKELVREFADCAGRSIGASRAGAPAPTGPAASAPRMSTILRRGLTTYVRTLLQRLRPLVDRVRRRSAGGEDQHGR